MAALAQCSHSRGGVDMLHTEEYTDRPARGALGRSEHESSSSLGRVICTSGLLNKLSLTSPGWALGASDRAYRLAHLQCVHAAESAWSLLCGTSSTEDAERALAIPQRIATVDLWGCAIGLRVVSGARRSAGGRARLVGIAPHARRRDQSRASIERTTSHRSARLDDCADAASRSASEPLAQTVARECRELRHTTRLHDLTRAAAGGWE